MSKISADQLKQSVIDAAWTQWRSLGSPVDAGRPATSVIDPEALLLLSLTLRDDERRLWDVLASWATSGSRLFSVQRAKNLLARFPGSARDRMAEFASIASTGGRDSRWKSLAGPVPGPPVRNQALRKPVSNVWESAALILRLRAGLGIGITPDLLGFLVSIKGGWATVRTIADAMDYSPYSIRRVADNVAEAGLIESTHSKPVEYRAKIDAWRHLLGLDRQLPEWRFWYQVYCFVAHLIDKIEGGGWDGLSPYLLSTQVRDLTEVHQEALSLNQIEVSNPADYPGEKYLPEFDHLISTLARWISASV